jgi:ATP-dependent Clp protease, protease subunit
MAMPDRHRLAAWLQEKLYERRIVLLSGRLDEHLAADVAAALMTLDAAGPAPIELHVDSADGAIDAAFIVIDMLDHVRAPVRVRCRGQVGGPSLGVVAAADRALAAPHTIFRLAQPTATYSGAPDAIAAWNRQQQDFLWRLYGRLARRTGRPAEEVAEDMRSGRYLDATQALDYGLIDEITS